MKHSTAAILTLIGALALSRGAAAQPAAVIDRPGFDFGLRLGYAIPFGDIDGNAGNGLASAFSGAVPLVFEAGYRLNPAFTLGALFQYAFAQLKDSNNGCPGNASCSGSVVRLGIEGIYRLPVAAVLAPWAGLALGYEWMDVTITNNGNSTSFGASGFEFITLQAGGDYRVAPNFGLGPFLSLSFARYGTVSATQGGNSTSTDIANPAVHEWLQIGVRGAFSL